MSAMANRITGISIVYSTAFLGADQRKQQSSASLAFVREIHRWTVDSPHKYPVTREMFPFDDVIMQPDGVGKWGVAPNDIMEMYKSDQHAKRWHLWSNHKTR